MVPSPEIPHALQTKGNILLVVLPLDTSYELTSEEEDFAAFRSKLSEVCIVQTGDELWLPELLHKYCPCFEKRQSLPPERILGKSYKIQVRPSTQPVHKNYYRLSPQQQDALRELLAEYMNNGKMDAYAGSK